jgi:DNA-binding transcriptional LysR family regulator
LRGLAEAEDHAGQDGQGGQERWVQGWGDVGGVLDMLAAVSGFQPRISCRSSDYRFMSALVGAGIGVALVPSLAVGGRVAALHAHVISRDGR